MHQLALIAASRLQPCNLTHPRYTFHRVASPSSWLAVVPLGERQCSLSIGVLVCLTSAGRHPVRSNGCQAGVPRPGPSISPGSPAWSAGPAAGAKQTNTADLSPGRASAVQPAVPSRVLSRCRSCRLWCHVLLHPRCTFTCALFLPQPQVAGFPNNVEFLRRICENEEFRQASCGPSCFKPEQLLIARHPQSC